MSLHSRYHRPPGCAAPAAGEKDALAYFKLGALFVAWYGANIAFNM
jgi:hypothetical protein